MGAAYFAFESCSVDGGVMAGIRLYYYVCVSGLPVDLRSESAIGVFCDEDIKKGDAAVFFGFTSELNSGVYAIENIVEGFGGFFVGGTAPKASATWCIIDHGAPTVVHIYLKMTR